MEFLFIFLKFFYKPYTPWLDPYFEGRETHIIRAEHINDDIKSFVISLILHTLKSAI